MSVKVPVIASANVGEGTISSMEVALADWAPRVRLLDA